MYEFNGWFKLAETPDDIDIGNLERIIHRLRQQLTSLNWSSGSVDLRPFNGMYFLTVVGASNRPRHYRSDLETIVAFLARETPGSYGLLYERDDEDASPPGQGEFRVTVLAKGGITRRFDPFLSPTIPSIES